MVTGVAFAQYDWEDVHQNAQRIEMESWGGIGYGDVAEGFASFALDLNYIGPLTIEVSVTEIRPGTQYEDDDSMLWLFDSRGRLIAENDDSPFGGYESLLNGVDITAPGRYYAVVTTLPNRPETDSAGQFISLGSEGGSNISFELIIEYGAREGGGEGRFFQDVEEPYDGPGWGTETEFFFEDFRDMAMPIQYDGGEVVRTGTVSNGIEVYRLTTSESTSVSVLAQAADGEYADTLLFVIDSFGNLLVEDDDSAGNGGALIYDTFINRNEEYYVVVTTFPNWPNMDEFGIVEGFPASGENYADYELVIGPPQEYTFEEDYYGSYETVVNFEAFDDYAVSVRYTGDEMYFNSTVSDGVSLYRVTVDEPRNVGAEVYAASGDYGDTIMFLIDENGYVIYEDDDGAGNGGSLIPDVYLEPGYDYYLAVTTFPNRPNYEDDGSVDGFGLGGEGYVDFELNIGAPRAYEGYDLGHEAEISIWFDDFPSASTRLTYEDETLSVSGTIEDGIAIYRLFPDEPVPVSIEASGADGVYADTILYLIDADGYVLAQDDDGAGNGGSLISEYYLDRTDGYYIVVTPYGNTPMIDFEGFIEGFETPDQGLMDIELVIGPPQAMAQYDGTVESVPAETYPDYGVPAYSFQEVEDSAQPIRIVNNSGIGSGEVGTGYSAFSIRISAPLYLTAEVVVTEVRQGVSYADSDSILSIFGPEGEWIASDDDGGVDAASRLDSVWLGNPGTYYAIVTTYPNEPQTSMGFFDYVDTSGESSIAFDLVVTTDFAAQ